MEILAKISMAILIGFIVCIFISPLIIASIIAVGCIEYILSYSDFAIDYGLIGIVVPVIIYFSKTKQEKLCFMFLALCCNVFVYGIIQVFSLLSIVLLAFYNGKRGSKNLKYFFYIYYPIHLVVIWLINFIL